MLYLQDTLRKSSLVALSKHTTNTEAKYDEGGIEGNRLVGHSYGNREYRVALRFNRLLWRDPRCPPGPLSSPPSSHIPGSLNCLFRDQWRGHCGLFKCCGVSGLGCQFLQHKQLMLGIQTTGKALRHPPSILDFRANDRMICYVGTSEGLRRRLKRWWNLRHAIASSCPCTFATLGLGLGGGGRSFEERSLCSPLAKLGQRFVSLHLTKRLVGWSVGVVFCFAGRIKFVGAPFCSGEV